MPEVHSLTTYIVSKLLVKRRVKVVLGLFLVACLLFLSYQYVSYSTLSDYQSHEYNKYLERKSGGFAARHRGGHNHHSLKDIAIALKFEEEKKHHLPIPNRGPTKGDTGPLVANVKAVGKPIFGEHVLGVPQESQKHYRRYNNKNFFTCLTTGKKISWDKVNDDFCDCPSDGSDEPSTAACMNGRFFCTKTKKGFPEYVPSAFVNDGICDCVDASDEPHRTPISCKNRAQTS